MRIGRDLKDRQTEREREREEDRQNKKRETQKKRDIERKRQKGDKKSFHRNSNTRTPRGKKKRGETTRDNSQFEGKGNRYLSPRIIDSFLWKLK